MSRARRRKHKYEHVRSALWKWGKLIICLWLASVAILRFVTPPITPLVFLRGVEYWFDGKPLVRGWEWKPLSYFPAHVQQAVIAAEDARYMVHWGIDLLAVGDVIDESDVSSRPRGASTITMQTVKNIFLWPGRSYVRKAIEGVMAPIAGVVWGKRRTLELYLNVIEWGEGIYGLEAAARHYYKRSARDLTEREAAALASILPAPRVLSPKNLSEASEKRFQRILKEAPIIAFPRS